MVYRVKYAVIQTTDLIETQLIRACSIKKAQLLKVTPFTV